MSNTTNDPRAIGDLQGFPSEIIDAMLDEQERQGNPRDVTVFQNCYIANKIEKGFNWVDSIQSFWIQVLMDKDFKLFFEKYPKPNLENSEVSYKKTHIESEPKSAIELIQEELERAKAKHPKFPTDLIHQSAIIAEESGELVRACLQHTYEGGSIEEVKKEIIQTGAMVLRMYEQINNSTTLK